MGNTGSASVDNEPVISVAAARSLIAPEEYGRIGTAFSRFKKSHLSFEDFCYHVLGDVRISEVDRMSLFRFFSRGNDQLSFDNLLCSLVGLCQVERVQTKFVEDYPQFKPWGLLPPQITLPMNDAYISFYEVMSYVTHLSVPEVKELEKVFATISDRTTCKMSRDRWDECLFDCFPLEFSHNLFRVFDENGDGFIDFREVVCSLSALCRGPYPHRIKYIAKLWDTDGDNMLSQEELETMYRQLKVADVHRTVRKTDPDHPNFATYSDFAVWVYEDKEANYHYIKEFCAMASEIGHICLGLRPETVQICHTVVTSFEKRTRGLNLREKNIVSSAWYKQWDSACVQEKPVPPLDNSSIRGHKDDDGWSNKVACISTESAGLRGDLGRDEFVAVPPPLWKAWLRWHGSALAVDGQFTRRYLDASFFEDGKAKLELYPLNILLMGYDKKSKRARESDGQQMVQQPAPWACAQVSRCMTVEVLQQLCVSELRLSEGDARLWLVQHEKDSFEETNTLLDDGAKTLFQLGMKNNKKIHKLLLEVKDESGVWPEEYRASLSGNQITSTTSSTYKARPGAVGLVNPGNFCYRNAAVQCLARVSPLTEYLMENVNELKEVSTNVQTTVEYAKLLKDLWEGEKKNIAPNRFNDALRAVAEQFNDHEQHDCQEFLAFLIEHLHGCLALQKDKPILKELSIKEPAEGVTLTEKEQADYAWAQHFKKENSVVNVLFSGQLRSSLICKSCKNTSVKFEVFTSLSLPIGLENLELYQIIVVRRDGQIPRRFGFRLRRDTTIGQFKEKVADASGISKDSLTIQCLGRSSHTTSACEELEDSEPVIRYPPGARLYALELPPDHADWRVASHRKLQYNHEPYLLGSTAGCLVSLFGIPLIVPCLPNVTGKVLYEDVMNQMQRFLNPTPPAFNRAKVHCEKRSTGEELYPFELAVVDPTGRWCGRCPAMKFCRGCVIRPDGSDAHLPEHCAFAVDWFPIDLYLKYNHSQELACVDDPSVEETWKLHVAPSSLEQCIREFSAAELLEEEIHCDTCKKKTRKEKVMSIWRLPQYLIVHLKRFEYVRSEGVMGKCRRIINFPLSHFDPQQFVEGPDKVSPYDCIAIANHQGVLSSGHFIAHARNQDNKWLRLNDCSVVDVDEQDVDKDSAYLIFYEKKID